MKKLTLLGALLASTAMQAQTFYWPGTRVETLTNGTKYFIYNTANDNGDRSYFLFSNGSGLRTNNISPKDFVTSENKYIFTLTQPESPASPNYWNIQSVDGYVGIAGVTNNSEVRDLYITPWLEENTGIAKGGAKSEDENGELQNPNEVNTKVFTITQNVNGGTSWNGNTMGSAGEGNAWTTYTDAHPYAFYTVVSKDVDPAAYAYSQELTARNGKLAELAYGMQKAFGLVQDGSKYYSNYKEASEGSYEGLLDGDDNTYFHSAWNNGGTDGTDPKHYLRAELSEPTTSFYFITKRRTQNNNNRPTSILIEGSNDDVAYTPIITISEGLPTAADDYFYFSDNITSETAYKYIRFTPQTTSPSQTRFFTYSEFYIIDGTQKDVVDAMSAVKGLYAQKGLTVKDEAFDSSFLTAGKAIDDELEKFNFKEAGNEAQKLLQANANNHADDPKLGQYPTTAYEALQNAVSVSQTSDELAAAIKAFKFSINAPVFTINGAGGGTNYSTVGKSIYYNADNANNPLSWNKATNKYDKTMLWKLAGLTTTEPALNTTYSAMNLSDQVYLWNIENMQITQTDPVNESGQVLIKTEGYPNPLHADAGGSIVRWGTFTEGSASAWTLEYVGESKNIEKINSDQLAAYAELQTLVSACEPFKDKIGTGLNQFTSDDLNPALEAAKAVIAQDIYENPTLNVTDVRDRLKAAKEALTVNQPEPGFYRIKSVSMNKYISSTPANDGRESLVDEADETTVFYLSADNRLTNSLGINLDARPRPAGNSLGSTFDFQVNNNGYYMIMITGDGEGNNKPLYPHTDPNNGNLLSYDFSGGIYADKLVDAWTLESVTETADQPVITKVMAADYATIAAPVALNVPADVTAYTVKVEGEVAKLTELSGVIPAGVPAVIKGTKGTTYKFTFAPDASTENNTDLRGVYVSTTIPDETVAYVLADGTQGVGFYLLDATDRTLAANKAYLVLPAGAENVKAFILNTGDLTGIESVATGAEAEEYYDLQGRRVTKPTKGIYVTKSGKKVIF